LDTDITVPVIEIAVSVPDIPVSMIEITISDFDIAVSVNEIAIFASDIPVSVIEIPVFALEIPISVIEIRLSMSQFPFFWQKWAKRASRSQNRRDGLALFELKTNAHSFKKKFLTRFWKKPINGLIPFSVAIRGR
jgi:hypothetical protein